MEREEEEEEEEAPRCFSIYSHILESENMNRSEFLSSSRELIMSIEISPGDTSEKGKASRETVSLHKS
jgi:hypothetical protein